MSAMNVIALPTRRKNPRASDRIARLSRVVESLEARANTTVVAFDPPLQARQGCGLTSAERLRAIYLLQKFAADMGLVITVQPQGGVA